MNVVIGKKLKKLLKIIAQSVPFKVLLMISLFCPIVLFGQKLNNKSSKNNDIITDFMQLSSQQLYDTAHYYFKNNSYDTALICYNLIINTTPKNADFEQQEKLMKVYNRLANIYFLFSDYRLAYDFLIKALLICEKYNLDERKTGVFSNLGIIYHYINHYDIAKKYFLKALELNPATPNRINLLNNIGCFEIDDHNLESGYHYLNEAFELSKQNKNFQMSGILGNFGSYYQGKKQYDSAFYFFRLSSEYALETKDINVEIDNLSNIGKLFFELNQKDSALYYIGLSNEISVENKFLDRVAKNYLILSEIEKSKGLFKNALDHYETYVNLKDSIYNAGVYGSINLIQRQYEVSKTDQQIEELIVDLKVKEQTIHHQKIIRRIMISAFLFTCAVFAYILLLHKKIRKFKKNILSHDIKDELINRILSVMNETSVICDPKFTVFQLSELVKSNQLYVSQIINNEFKKNFRSFLNSYRIKEAQRIFLSQEAEKYTIEHVASKVGFKSRTAFREAFKEITGNSPSIYLKSIKEQ